VVGVVETLRRAVTRDRLRVLTDVRALGREVGVPAVWFRGRSPLLLPEAFVRLWPNPGRWYVDPGGPIQPGLLQLPDPAAFHVRLSANWPVALGEPRHLGFELMRYVQSRRGPAPADAFLPSSAGPATATPAPQSSGPPPCGVPHSGPPPS
jgi:hypothetical protein